MPNVSSVNLSYLNRNMTGSATALIKLADFANGPLRLKKKVENGDTVTYLGVRSWSTYFFEKLVATPAQKANARMKTQAAIEQHVRKFLVNGELTMVRNAQDLTAALQSKVVGKSITPKVVAHAATNQVSNSSTRPAYSMPSGVIETKGRAFRGATTVPAGMSVAVISPLKVIANVRLVTETTLAAHPTSNLRKGVTVSQGLFVSDRRTSGNDYKTYYLDCLKSVTGLIETSVVLELQRDAKGKCSDDNLEGARQAAAAFVKLKKLEGKHVSVMLTVPELPSVAQPASATVKVIDTAAKRTSGNIIVHQPAEDTQSESEYLE